jgi:hypothetical protein
MRNQGGLISVFGRNWRATFLSLRPETSRLSKVSKAQLTRNGRGVEDSESQSHVSGPVPPETLKKCDRTRAPVAQPWSPQHRLRCCLVGMRVVLFCVLWHALGRLLRSGGRGNCGSWQNPCARVYCEFVSGRTFESGCRLSLRLDESRSLRGVTEMIPKTWLQAGVSKGC